MMPHVPQCTGRPPPRTERYLVKVSAVSGREPVTKRTEAGGGGAGGVGAEVSSWEGDRATPSAE